MGAFRAMEPLYRVATQEKILMAVGTATRNVRKLKMTFARADCPEVNM